MADPELDNKNCTHDIITTYKEIDGGSGRMWACSICRRRFYPACPVCISVGHRGKNAHSNGSFAVPIKEEKEHG